MMKKNYKEMTKPERQAEYAAVKAEFEGAKALHLELNMARGKPSRQQLDMVTPMLQVLTQPEQFVSDGVETRNYGEVAGIPAARKLFADILGCKPEQVFVGGNASLQLMYDAISKAFTHGLLHSEKPWAKLDTVKWICPVPGYDRHFKVTGSFGVEMINVPMTDQGPDMDMVEELIKDPAVKGMWNVPKYSNPEGVVYSDETIRRLAAMKPAAPDFMLMWDNAYCIHEFDCDFVPFSDIIGLCAQYGNADMVYEFASTSKVTFPGAGVAVMAASEANIQYFSKLINIQTIGYDKVNQLRHVLYLQDREHTLALMKRHAAVLAPKFHAVLNALDSEIAPRGIADYKRPVGGYFISVDTMHGCAKRTLELCREAGITMTGAGATFPYGKDLAAHLPVQPEDVSGRQRRVAAVGVALDAQPLGDDGAEDVLYLRHMGLERHVLTQILVYVPQRQRQVAQHAAPPPLRQLQHILQITVDKCMIIRFRIFFNVVQVKISKFFPRHVDGPDDEIQLGRVIQQMLRPVKGQIRLAQLRAQPDGEPVAVQPPRLRQLRLGLVPVEVPAGLEAAPADGVHMVGDADLVQPAGHGGLRHAGDGFPPVGGAVGMGVIISQIHTAPYFFLRKSRKLLRFS